jgi:hypothetical protein
MAVIYHLTGKGYRLMFLNFLIHWQIQGVQERVTV